MGGGGGGSNIPSEELIQRAKARREQARKFGMGAGAGTGGRLAPEFIPLEDSVDEAKVSWTVFWPRFPIPLPLLVAVSVAPRMDPSDRSTGQPGD